jgi:hypothetical protein
MYTEDGKMFKMVDEELAPLSVPLFWWHSCGAQFIQGCFSLAVRGGVAQLYEDSHVFYRYEVSSIDVNKFQPRK